MLKFNSNDFHHYINFIELITLPLAITSLLFILCYYFFFFIKLNKYIKKKDSFNQPISIIICAKNEIDNLKINLPLILNQNYFNFEVIVVNDQSTDDTTFFLEELAKNNNKLVVVNIDNFIYHKKGKKFALTLGIKTSKNEHLLLTDADCTPNSKNWVQQISANFNNADIILGYGPYEKKKGLLNKIIRYDVFNIAQQYFSYALSGYSYMGVGRNLAYKKSLFFKNKGFANHIHIPSGDDDLFIQEIAEKNNVAIEISDESHTTSKVMESWKDWIFQKRRHISTAPLYKIQFKILLSLYPIMQLLFLLSIIILCIIQKDITCMIILLSIKLFVSYTINYRTMKQLSVYDLYWLHPIYEMLHLLIQGNFVLLNIFQKPRKWRR